MMNYKQISRISIVLGFILSVIGISNLSTRMIFGGFYFFLLAIYSNIETLREVKHGKEKKDAPGNDDAETTETGFECYY